MYTKMKTKNIYIYTKMNFHHDSQYIRLTQNRSKTKYKAYNYKTSTGKQKKKTGNFCEYGLCKDFLDRIPKVQFIKEKMDKLDFIKI